MSDPSARVFWWWFVLIAGLGSAVGLVLNLHFGYGGP